MEFVPLHDLKKKKKHNLKHLLLGAREAAGAEVASIGGGSALDTSTKQHSNRQACSDTARFQITFPGLTKIARQLFLLSSAVEYSSSSRGGLAGWRGGGGGGGSGSGGQREGRGTGLV